MRAGANSSTNAPGELRRGIDTGVFPGADMCVRRNGRVVLHEAVGTTDGVTPTTLDTLYDLASLTKPMATAACALALAERGQVSLDASVRTVLPEAPAAFDAVTFAHLLLHTSGLPAHCHCFRHGRGIGAAVDAILAQPLVAPPGTCYAYSCLGHILLAHLLERAMGAELDALARTEVFEPLGLDVTFRPAYDLKERIAPTRSRERVLPDEMTDGSDDGGSGNASITLCGVVHDGNARAIGGVAGNAGLFGTARDAAAFGDALLHPATSRLPFGPATVERTLRNQLPPDIGAQTLMLFARGNPLCPTADGLSPATVGHSGYTGTALVIDAASDLVIALLTNRVYLGDDRATWLTTRGHILDALARVGA